MPKTLSVGLKDHLQQDTTSVCTCWRIIRRDGVVMAFTDHDTDIVIDADGDGELTYVASLGYNRSAVDNDVTMSVDNLEVEGFIDDAAITAEDVRAGLYDMAVVEIFIVNWADLSQGIMRLRKGWFGEVLVTPNGIFRTELRGLTQALTNQVVAVSTPECRADLGDSRCKIPVDPALVARSTAYTLGQYIRVAAAGYDLIFRCTGAGTTAGSAPAYSASIGISTTDGTAVFTCENAWTRAASVDAGATIGTKVVRVAFGAFDARATADPEWYTGGLMTFLSGPNTGRSVEVKYWTDLGGGLADFEMALPLAYPFTLTDTVYVAPGCDKRYAATCIAKYGNRLNFRGEPFLPGQDLLMQYPDAR